MIANLPVTARIKRFASPGKQHIFVVGGSRIFDIAPDLASRIDDALRLANEQLMPPDISALLQQHASPPAPLSHAPAVQALSLNLVQSCNMGCSYCYAEGGTFGGARRAMSAEVARRSVDRLLESVPAGGRAVIAYMGGEPFLAGRVLHETTRYAWEAARRAGRSIAFSVTTNATMVGEADAELLATYPFSVTVSLDGPPEVHDRQRPMANGRSSFARVRRGLDQLLARPPRELTARMSVTATTGRLQPILDYVLSLGFTSAGFSPVIASPNGQGDLAGETLAAFTEEVISCGRHALAEWIAGRPYHFSNFEAAMSELHRGSARAHPCGAGAGYLSIDAEGQAFGCHRLVGDKRFSFGSIGTSFDDEARLAHLTARTVDTQEPCRSCWARYLCGGGCYHEVANRGRGTCDHVRGWLAFCLEAYAQLSDARPDLFQATPGAAAALAEPMSEP